MTPEEYNDLMKMLPPGFQPGGSSSGSGWATFSYKGLITGKYYHVRANTYVGLVEKFKGHLVIAQKIENAIDGLMAYRCEKWDQYSDEYRAAIYHSVEVAVIVHITTPPGV